MRGFLRAADYNNCILLLVNGHKYNDDIYQSALLGTEFGIDLEAVERVEVVRGPGSALYGGNALFAVINVVTRDALALGNGVQVETGSFYRKKAQANVAHTFDNGASFVASGSALDVDGRSRLYFPELDYPESNNGVANDADGDQALNLYTAAKYGSLEFQGGVNRREKHIPTGVFGTTLNEPGTKSLDSRAFAELSYEYALLPELSLKTRGFYDYYDYEGDYIYGAGADRVNNFDDVWSHSFGTEIQSRWTPVSWGTVTFGGEYSFHPNVTQKNFDKGSDEVILDDARSYNAWGLYAQSEVKLWDRLTLFGGIRFDRFYNDIDQFSPRLAAVWRMAEATNVKVLFGQAFRPPNLFEQYYAFEEEGFVELANPNLDPETIYTYEAVLEQRLWGDAQATAAVFHNEIEDLIDLRDIESPLPGVDVVQYQNLSSARATGVELEVRVPVTEAVSVRGNYSFQYARDGGGQLSNSPKHLGNFGVLFPVLFDVVGGAELRLVGHRQTLGRQTLKTVAVANINLVWPTPMKGLSFSSGLYNLFDQKFFDPAGPEFEQDRIPQDRLTFRIAVRYDL